MKFKVGDYAVHPSHGVGEVSAVQAKEIAGSKTEFYIIKTLEKKSRTVMVAVEAAKRMGLRRVISRNDVKKVMDVLKSDEVAVKSQPWNRRQREYNEMLNSGSPFEVAKVFRDLYRLKSDKELSFSERRLLEQAESLLISELALARKVKTDKIHQDIEKILGP